MLVKNSLSFPAKGLSVKPCDRAWGWSETRPSQIVAGTYRVFPSCQALSHYCYPKLSSEVMEAQRGEMTCLPPHGKEAVVTGLC